MGLLCAILICVGASVSLAIPDQRASTTAEDVITTSSPVIEQLLERMDMLGVKQSKEIQSMKAEISQQASEIQSLKAEMSQQASEIQSMKAEMSQQASEIQSMKADMSQQASETQSLKADMSQQASEIQSMKADMSHHRAYVNRIRSKLYTKNMLIQRLLSGAIKPTKGEDLPGSENVERLSSETTIVPEGKQQTQDIRDTVKRIIPVDNIPVAFFASLTHPFSLDGSSHNIVFDHVETNVGNAYNSSTGDFIAPVPGIYVFSTTLLSDDSAYFPDLLYTVNRYSKSRLYINPNQREMVSKTVVFQLNKGDRVAIYGTYVRLREAVIKKFNTFSGFLLHQTTTSSLLTPVVG